MAAVNILAEQEEWEKSRKRRSTAHPTQKVKDAAKTKLEVHTIFATRSHHTMFGATHGKYSVNFRLSFCSDS